MEEKDEKQLIEQLVDNALITAISLLKFMMIYSNEFYNRRPYDEAFLNRLIAMISHHNELPKDMGLEKVVNFSKNRSQMYDMDSLQPILEDFKTAAEEYINYYAKSFREGIPYHKCSTEMESLMYTIAYSHNNTLYIMDGDGPENVKLTSDNCVFYEAHEGSRISLLILLKDRMSVYEMFKLNPMNSVMTIENNASTGMSNVYAVRVIGLDDIEDDWDLLESMTTLTGNANGAYIHKVIDPYIEVDTDKVD